MAEPKYSTDKKIKYKLKNGDIKEYIYKYDWRKYDNREKALEKYECKCGTILCNTNRYKHNKTKGHLKRLTDLLTKMA